VTYLPIMIENETDFDLNDAYTDLINQTVNTCLEYVKCPFETDVSITLVDNTAIREMNKTHRGIDRITDVLSFPLIEFEMPSDFSFITEEDDDYFNLDTGELLLGDIVISIEKAKEQAIEYEHSFERELGFLIVHSMLHLFGYDHMEDYEADLMFSIQESILEKVGLLR
jgi:probable rRNA maturation factor